MDYVSRNQVGKWQNEIKRTEGGLIVSTLINTPTFKCMTQFSLIVLLYLSFDFVLILRFSEFPQILHTLPRYMVPLQYAAQYTFHILSMFRIKSTHVIFLAPSFSYVSISQRR